jgi:hypothetical protein
MVVEGDMWNIGVAVNMKKIIYGKPCPPYSVFL